MAALPAGGVIRYSSYTFPSNVETTAISVVPQYDQAGRTCIYNRIKISLRAVLTGTAIDAAVRAVTQVLTKPAYQFVYTGSGYGLTVNVGSVRDVVWGPKPTEASVTPLGGGHAAELRWSCEVCIPDGPSFRGFPFPLSFNFTLAYDVDASGYTTRTYDATVRIPQTRAFPNARTIEDSADRLLEQITPALLPGFRRIPGSHFLSADKCELTHQCQDVQLPPNVPPAGVIDCSASHTLNTVPGTLDKKWIGNLEATYEIARNGKATAADAIVAFLALMQDRLKHTRDTLERLRPSLTAGAPSPEPVVMPLAFSLAEPELYGRTKVKIGMSYMIGAADLPSMLQASGMWRRAPRSDERAWVASVGGMLGPRGHGLLAFNPNDDRIVDLLQPVPPSVGLIGQLNQRAGQGAAGSGAGTVFTEPTPENSWLNYTCAVYVECDNGVVEVRTLPTEARTAAGDLYGGGPTAGGGLINSAVSGALGSVATAFPAIAANPNFFFPPPRKPDQQKKGGGIERQPPQRRARQTGAIYLIGRAARLRFGIPPPTLTKWNDVNLIPANRPDRGEGFWTAVVGNALWPVTVCRFKLRFVPDGPLPSETPPVVPNPLFGGGGAAAATLPSNLGDILNGVQLPFLAPFG